MTSESSMDEVLQVMSDKGGVEGENLSWPAVHATFAAAQDVFVFPGCKHPLLCHVHTLLPQGWSFLDGGFALSLVELHSFMKFLLAHFSHLSKPLWKVTQSSGVKHFMFLYMFFFP